jgi:hypothetical protein
MYWRVVFEPSALHRKRIAVMCILRAGKLRAGGTFQAKQIFMLSAEQHLHQMFFSFKSSNYAKNLATRILMSFVDGQSKARHMH